MDTNRRKFIKNTAVAAAAISVAPAVLNACASPAEKITVALIGCRSMGFNDLVSFLKEGNNVECVALCDVDSKVLEDKAAEVEKLTGKRPQVFADFRKVLDHPDIDAVIIGTPDHGMPS
jgi:predicted dehydrogenase